MKRPLKTITLLLLAITLVGELAAQNPNRGLRIPRTITEPNDETTLVQAGGMAFLSDDFPAEEPYTVGFWLRQEFDNEAVNAEVDDPFDHIIFSFTADYPDLERRGLRRAQIPPASGRLDDPPIDQIPPNERWHYVVARFDGQGNIRFYVNGTFLNTSIGYFNLFSFGAISLHDLNTGEIWYKFPTEWNVIIDDIAIWNSNSLEILELTRSIARYGQGAFDPNHPNLLTYYDCNSIGNSPDYFEDSAFFDRPNSNSDGYFVDRADPPLVDVQEKPKSFAIVTINSEYGAERVTPKVSESGDFAVQSNLDTPTSFSAPPFVYLDRYGNELDPTPENIRDHAFYRAVNTGYTVQGGEVDVPGQNSFQELIQTDITVTWTWDLEVAVIVESATEEYNDISDSDGNPLLSGAPIEQQNQLNKVFVAPGTNLNATISNLVIPGADINIGGQNQPTARFSNNGLVIDNHPTETTDRSIRFDGSATGATIFKGSPSFGDFTVEYWVQRDPTGSVRENIYNLDPFGTNDTFDIGFIRADDGDGYETFIESEDGMHRVDARFVDDGNWHHWAWIYNSATKDVECYRDNKLVASFTGIDFDQPFTFNADAHSFGTSQRHPGFAGGLNNFRVWTKRLDRDELEVARTTQVFGNTPDLSLEFSFDSPETTPTLRIQSETTLGGAAVAEYNGADLLFPAGVSDTEKLDILFPSFVFDSDLPDGNSVGTGEITVDDWLRISWYWKAEFRLDVTTASDGSDGGTVGLLPYVRTSGPGPDLMEAGSIWVPELETVTVGTLFRTPDRFYTLGAGNQISSVLNQTGTFGNISDADLADGTYDGAVSREFTIDKVLAPGTITFNFTPTIFRAFIPIGESLDAENPNVQLVPNLPGASPVLSATPEIPFSDAAPGIEFRNGFIGTRSLHWDSVGKRVLPVNPGIFQVRWPDAQNAAIAYNIEVITGFPTDEEDGFYFELEDENGYRLTDGGGDFVTSFLFPGVSDAYPASPQGHYRIAFDPKAPGVELDPNDADRWYFLEHSFAESQSAAFDDVQRILTADSTGRSVLLFSYSPNPEDTATGNRNTEALAVRVVNSTPLTSVGDPDVSSGTRREFAPEAGSEDHYLVMSFLQAQNTEFSPAPDNARTLDFWFSLNELEDDYTLDRMLAELRLTFDESISVGVRGPGHPTAPNRIFMERPIFGDLMFDNEDFVESTAEVKPGQMHHLAVVYDGAGSKVQAFLDGQLIIELARPNLINSTCVSVGAGISFLRKFRGFEDTFLNGRIDNLRFWERALTPAEIRQYRGDYTSETPAILHQFDEATLDPFANTGSGGGAFILFRLFVDDPPEADEAFFAQEFDTFPEVASRITSRLDSANLGSGFILNEVSNYNANYYNRENPVGTWGPIFPVNWGGFFSNNHQLSVLYYENPFRQISGVNRVGETDVIHPNVNWPYVAVNYDNVTFPDQGPDAENRIYISSRLGTEGVDRLGNDQLVFDPASTSELAIYNQPDLSVAGYNPNEEHCVLAPSIKAVLTGDSQFALGQDAIFALQNDLNVWGENDSDTAVTTNKATEFSSEPWALVEYLDSEGEQQMAAYKVEATRTVDGSGTALAATELFPALDPTTNAPIDPNGTPVAQPVDPRYDFIYPAFAGDLLTAPYPLNVVIGATLMENSWGGNLSQQRGLWKANDGFHWVVSGDGEFFFKNWYPLREDFWFDQDLSGTNDVATGTPIAWVPDGSSFLEDGDDATEGQAEGTQPATILYDTYWKSDYPVLKRGETLSYQGGEYKAENPSAPGLPAVLAWASAELVFDSENLPMSLTASTVDQWSARIVRPLDGITSDWDQSAFPTSPVNLTPSNPDKILVDGTRWYFKDLAGSLQKRFYFDVSTQQLVFCGKINDLEGGSPDLTATPVSLYVLEPNIMTVGEYQALRDLNSADSAWTDIIDSMFLRSQDPHQTGLPTSLAAQNFNAGVEPIAAAFVTQPEFFNNSGRVITSADASIASPEYSPLNSLGTGATLVPNPDLLGKPTGQARYITLAENNHPDVGGAVTIHVIRVGDERYRGAIKLVEAQDAFDEKINLQHTGDFAANSEENYYEWWVREIDSLQNVGLPGEDPEWLPYKTGRGLHSITFEGDPATALSDKLFFVRYGLAEEFLDIDALSNDLTPGAESVSGASWRLVDLNNPLDTWSRAGAADTGDGSGGRVPYQWAGAANSPQLQADGSLTYIPQLIPGWVKRVLDRINPYEARYTNFYNEESPSIFSSQLQLAGGPYIGPVALNSSKNAIENVGLIELYRTILDRAKNLSVDNQTNPEGGFGIQQALLLATTRLATLYELLAQEAYSDAQDPTITVPEGDGLSDVAPYIHAFYNQEASMLHEELALLRGTDYRKAYPSFNRLFWNYVKGLGEAAYNKNYNIQDVNEDGIINEFDAAELYPMGHGDAYGHSLSALKMSYELLRNNLFDWEARPELYSLLDNVIEADYLDELRFSKIAAERARTAAQIVEGTYALEYTEDPDAQWQGYTDPDPARAWGVSEWARRGGHGAYFDWLAGNAMLPTDADDLAGEDETPENLEQLDRNATRGQLAEIATAKLSIQSQLDQANRGGNPLGLDADAIAFDIQPLRYDQSAETPFQEGHFLQSYHKAVSAADNALAALSLATQENRKIQRVSNDTRALQVKAVAQDMTYRNQLTTIFGQPYAGLIGPGQIYEEGYIGPDLLLYNYIDRTEVNDLQVAQPSQWTGEVTNLNRIANDFSNTVNWDHWNLPFFGVKVRESIKDMFDEYYVTADPAPGSQALTLPVQQEASDYAFKADPSWGQRLAPGELQIQLEKILQAEVRLERAIQRYLANVENAVITGEKVEDFLRSQKFRQRTRNQAYYQGVALQIIEKYAAAQQAASQVTLRLTQDISNSVQEGAPTAVGFSNDIGAPIRGTVLSTSTVAKTGQRMINLVSAGIAEGAALAAEALESYKNERLRILSEYNSFSSLVAELGKARNQEQVISLEISSEIQALQIAIEKYRNTLAGGFSIVDEREVFNQVLAASAQRNRYSDMIFRISRNDAVADYRDAFQHLQRYAWLAAKAYDYELGFSAGHPYAATTSLERIQSARHLGQWIDGEPQIGQGGIAEILAQLRANFESLSGQLGLNQPEQEVGTISMRRELFRIGADEPAENQFWQQELMECWKDDLWDVPEFVEMCRPFADREDGPQPGLVIEFSSLIESGKNFFGRELQAGDHAYSTSRLGTRIFSAGVIFDNYLETELSATPRVYLVPVGADVMRTANGQSQADLRVWNVVEERIPAPFIVNEQNLVDPEFNVLTDSLDGAFGDEIRRFPDTRAYASEALVETPVDGDLVGDNRLIGRSIANTRWLLIIPGATFRADPEHGLRSFVETVSDIKLQFETFSHSGY